MKNKSKYTGELVYKVIDVELSATQADDFILVVSGVTENNVAYEPRLIQITPKQPNTLRFSFKAIHEPNKRKDEGTITTAITILPEELENIEKILIESKKNQDQDYLGLIGINLNDKKYFTTDHPFYQLFYNYPQLLENFVKINMPEVNTIGEPDKNNRNLILQQFKEELIKNNPKNIQELIFKAFQKINPDMMVVDRTGTQRNVFQKLYSLIETISLREKENK